MQTLNESSQDSAHDREANIIPETMCSYCCAPQTIGGLCVLCFSQLTPPTPSSIIPTCVTIATANQQAIVAATNAVSLSLNTQSALQAATATAAAASAAQEELFQVALKQLRNMEFEHLNDVVLERIVKSKKNP